MRLELAPAVAAAEEVAEVPQPQQAAPEVEAEVEAMVPPAQAPAVLMQLLSLVAQTQDLAIRICGLIPALPLPVRRWQHPEEVPTRAGR